MHVPSGFCSLPVELAAGALAAGALALTARPAWRSAAVRGPLLLGAVLAGLFAVQACNLPVPGGTSVHPLGALAAARVLGPALACWGLALVLGLQAVAFGDGGLSALGINLLTMGGVAGLGAWWLQTRLAPRTGELPAAGIAAALGALAAAAACAIALWASGHPVAVVPAMLDAHLGGAVAEALLTLVVAMALRSPSAGRLVPIPVRSRGR